MRTSEAKQKFIEYCEKQKLSPETIKWYRVFIDVLEKKHDELPTTQEPIEDIIASYPGQYRALGCFRALRAFYNWLCPRFKIPNPFKEGSQILIKSPKVPKQEKPTVTLEQMKELLEHPSHSKPLRALLYLLCDTGCRIGEASSLFRSSVLEDKVTISGKTGMRTVPISPKTRDLLLELRADDFTERSWKKKKPDCVFMTGTETLTRWVSDAFKKIGLPGYHSHLLRHSFCTLFRGDLMTLRTITGHTNWQTLEGYTHNKLAKAIEQHVTGSPLAQIGKNGIDHKPDENKPVVIENKTALVQDVGDRILISVPASFTGKSITISLN